MPLPTTTLTQQPQSCCINPPASDRVSQADGAHGQYIPHSTTPHHNQMMTSRNPYWLTKKASLDDIKAIK